MKTLDVNLGARSYTILVGGRALTRAAAVVEPLGFETAPIIITNRTVFELHGGSLLDGLKRFGPSAIVEIGDGERFKSHQTLFKLYREMLRIRADRRSWILSLGGGVVGDIAGFAAATFMRGIRFVNAPTTLLAQVDSSVGGKVGINVPEGKNLVGAFHQPSAVLSDVSTLGTLPDRELGAGLFEVVKTAAIWSEPFVGYLERSLPRILERKANALEHVVVEACRVKAEVVSKDEREQSLRMILNFGHTVGHALEAATAYRRFKHGEAVGWGMLAALAFGRTLGRMDDRSVARLGRLISRVAPLPSLRGIGIEGVWTALCRDKKFRSGGIRMAMLSAIGRCEIVTDVDPDELRRFLVSFLASPGAYFAPGDLR
jgi:3-dehydroquinate synthase